MDLKTKDGMQLVTEIEYQQITEVKTLIPILRNSVSKSWRLMDKLMKILDNSVSAKAA